jgi:hypothetical protein
MVEVAKRWENMGRFLSRSSPFGNETGQLPNGYFTPGPELLQSLCTNSKVLVVGAGGLGCEILKVVQFKYCFLKSYLLLALPLSKFLFCCFLFRTWHYPDSLIFMSLVKLLISTFFVIIH